MPKLTKKQQNINTTIAGITINLFMDKIEKFIETYRGGNFEYSSKTNLKRLEGKSYFENDNLSELECDNIIEIGRLMVVYYIADDKMVNDEWCLDEGDGYIFYIGKCENCSDIHCLIRYEKPEEEEEPTSTEEEEPKPEETTNPQE